MLKNYFTQLAQVFAIFSRSQCRFLEMLENKLQMQDEGSQMLE
jgi:hypothetical protein